MNVLNLYIVQLNTDCGSYDKHDSVRVCDSHLKSPGRVQHVRKTVINFETGHTCILTRDLETATFTVI